MSLHGATDDAVPDGSVGGVTVVRPARTGSAPRVDLLRDAGRRELDRFLGDDPIVNAVLIARLASTRTIAAEVLGGALLGVRTTLGVLAAVAFHGGNLLPAGGDEDDWAALAAHLATTRRLCTSVVGRAETVEVMWPALQQSWGTPRAIRRRQPLLVVGRGETPGGGDPNVRVMTRDDVDSYLPAAAAMFAEELGVSPFAGRSGATYRRRVEALIAGRRAMGIIDRAGEVVFKADLAVLTSETCQVQGVWVRPDLRGRGIGTAALAAVFEHALQLAPTVSLYVNDFNHAARAVYARLGMHQIATLATVLL